MNIVNILKENEQDFEFYPSTKKMLKVIFDNYIENKKNYHGMAHNFSMLDIGTGNGNVFDIFEELLPLPKDDYTSKTQIKKFAIEKSEILINNMSNDIIIVGTDFLKQTLIDKKVDLIFCNPPYKQYKQWMLKILKEANCERIYLIIPERWKNNEEILSVIKKRGIKYEIIFSDDFLDSEYRQARTKIDIIKIELKDNKQNDPFNIWFEENFKINAEKEKKYDYEEKKTKNEQIKELINGKNIIEILEELYQKDLEKLLNTYKQLENIDYDLFQEMGVNLSNLKSGLREKIEGLKNLYWRELFDNLDKITNKLTTKSRKKILGKLSEQTNIDFSIQNAYALIIWVLKNANIYIDEQLKEIYFEMADKENIRNYKSNKKLVEDGWRYQKNNQTHFKLDYRLVFKRYSCFNSSNWGDYEFPNHLSRDTNNFLNDICTIANNLGFQNIDNSFKLQWRAGKENVFYYDMAVKLKEFMRVRAYKNGNVHCKFNQEFMKKLNIEMARINKWVKNEKECAEELEIDITEVQRCYNCNKKLVKSNIKLLNYSKEK